VSSAFVFKGRERRGVLLKTLVLRDGKKGEKGFLKK
jgi:hypothetical protein